VGNGVYTITEEGRAYLREEYDASESNDVNMSSNNGNNGVEQGDEV
jgi:DNA-binding PadR family transcriptional regulator